MSTKRLKEALLVIVPHTKLLTRLTDDGSNLRIVKLTYAWEEMMGCLMIESSCKIRERMIGYLKCTRSGSHITLSYIVWTALNDTNDAHMTLSYIVWTALNDTNDERNQ